MFPCLEEPQFWIEYFLRIVWNFGSLCVPSVVKSLPGNSHWDRRLQSTAAMRRWLSTSHLHGWFLPCPTGVLCLRSCCLCSNKITSRDLAKQHSSCWSMHNYTSPSLPHFLMGIWRNKFWSVAVEEGGKTFSTLLSPVLLSVFALKEVSLPKETKSFRLLLRFRWDTHQGYVKVLS